MRWKPLSQWISIWVFLFLPFPASLKNLSKNKKVVPFPGKRTVIVMVYGVPVRWVLGRKMCAQRPCWATPELQFGVSVHIACLAWNKTWPSHDCALTSANPLLYGTIFRWTDKGGFSLCNIVTLSVRQPAIQSRRTLHCWTMQLF